MRLQAEATAGHIRLAVTDSGGWKEPQPEAGRHRGRGLLLMRGLVDLVAVKPGAHGGTTVALQTGIAL